MTIEEMKRRKKELGYSNEKLAEVSGVPVGTVMKIFGGVTKSPRYQTIQALEKALVLTTEGSSPGFMGEGSAMGKSQSGNYSPEESSLTEKTPAAETRTSSVGRHDGVREYGMEGITPGFAQEAAPVYKVKEKKKYTIDDYYAFKDEKRRELIDGKFFIMEAPTVKHQVIIGELHILFRECMRLHGKKCRVLLSPCDVQLDADRYTMVQPDLLVVCDEEKIRARVCMGAPDLLVEVMSASSRSRDAVLKLNKYTRAGVREYWLVDPENETVIVYIKDEKEGEGGGRYRQYSFADTIPVGISGGGCRVDFSIVAKEIEGLA